MQRPRCRDASAAASSQESRCPPHLLLATTGSGTPRSAHGGSGGDGQDPLGDAPAEHAIDGQDPLQQRRVHSDPDQPHAQLLHWRYHCIWACVDQEARRTRGTLRRSGGNAYSVPCGSRQMSSPHGRGVMLSRFHRLRGEPSASAGAVAAGPAAAAAAAPAAGPAAGAGPVLPAAAAPATGAGPVPQSKRPPPPACRSRLDLGLPLPAGGNQRASRLQDAASPEVAGRGHECERP